MVTSSRPVVHVRLFARYADLLGTELLEVPAGEVVTAGDVLDRIRALPGGEAIGRSALVAVNLRQVVPDHRVVAGDEVALLPPLAGG